MGQVTCNIPAEDGTIWAYQVPIVTMPDADPQMAPMVKLIPPGSGHATLNLSFKPGKKTMDIGALLVIDGVRIDNVRKGNNDIKALVRILDA